MKPAKTFLRRAPTREQADALRRKYDEFINTAFRVTRLPDLKDEEKVQMLTDAYKTIADINIERNSAFLERLASLKGELQAKSDKTLTQIFIEVLLLLREADIVSHIDYVELVCFQNKAESSNESQILNITQVVSQQKEPVKDDLLCLHNDPKIAKTLKAFVLTHDETPQSRQNKKRALDIVDEIFRKVDFASFDSECRVNYSLYGSYVNEISVPGSDIDISLNVEPECDEGGFLRFFLKRIRPDMARYDVDIVPVLHIAVPFLDIKFNDLDVTVSFTVNNKLAVTNSRMLKIYMNLDPRCKWLCLIVKIWANIHQIISAKKIYLSSYAYNLMVINFLQTIDPPILPSLQAIRARDISVRPQYTDIMRENKTTKVNEKYRIRIDFEDDMMKLKQVMAKDYSKNKKTVIELLADFFEFYQDAVNLDFVTLSIKEGRLNQRNLNDNKEASYLYSIEDPFDPTRNAGRHVKAETQPSSHAQKILSAMKLASYCLKQGEILDIFSP